MHQTFGGATFASFAEPPLTAPVHPVRQERDYSCGASALLAICGRYGVDADEAGLRRLLGTDPDDGTSPERIVAAPEPSLTYPAGFHLPASALVNAKRRLGSPPISTAPPVPRAPPGCTS